MFTSQFIIDLLQELRLNFKNWKNNFLNSCLVCINKVKSKLEKVKDGPSERQGFKLMYKL